MSKREVKEEDLLIGKKLKKARESKGFLLKDMAEATGLSANHICDIECGRSKGSIRLLLGYCKKLDMTPDEVLGYCEKGMNISSELEKAIENLDAEEQERLLQILRLTFNK